MTEVNLRDATTLDDLFFELGPISKSAQTNLHLGQREPQPNPDWLPRSGQLSFSSKYLYFDAVAGFFHDGLHVNDLQADDDGTYAASVDGYSEATGKTPFSVEYTWARKKPDPTTTHVYDARGPSLKLRATYRTYEFIDRGWKTTLSDDQVNEAVDDAGDGVAGAFDTTVPDSSGVDSPEDVDSFLEAIERWANSNQSGFISIPSIIKHAFDDYDPNDDLGTGFSRSKRYTVPTVGADLGLCYDFGSYWDYNKKFLFLHEGRGCFNGSAKVFADPDFNTNLFAGGGPELEWTLVSYNHKAHGSYAKGDGFVPPQYLLSTFFYVGGEYFTGVGKHADNDRFLTFDIGLGVRTTFPSVGGN